MKNRKAKPANKERMTYVRLDEDTFERLRQVGHDADRPVVWVIRAAIDAYLREHAA